MLQRPDVRELPAGCGSQDGSGDAHSAEVRVGDDQHSRSLRCQFTDETQRGAAGQPCGVEDSDVRPLVGERLGGLQVLDNDERHRPGEFQVQPALVGAQEHRAVERDLVSADAPARVQRRRGGRSGGCRAR
jgi:hypothetical protein